MLTSEQNIKWQEYVEDAKLPQRIPDYGYYGLTPVLVLAVNKYLLALQDIVKITNRYLVCYDRIPDRPETEEDITKAMDTIIDEYDILEELRIALGKFNKE